MRSRSIPYFLGKLPIELWEVAEQLLEECPIPQPDKAGALRTAGGGGIAPGAQQPDAAPKPWLSDLLHDPVERASVTQLVGWLLDRLRREESEAWCPQYRIQGRKNTS